LAIEINSKKECTAAIKLISIMNLIKNLLLTHEQLLRAAPSAIVIESPQSQMHAMNVTAMSNLLFQYFSFRPSDFGVHNES
jgi:hypothetical protein